MSVLSISLRTTVAGLALGLVGASLGVVPGLSSAPAAHAATGGGSIVYVKDHNVWITDGDGSFHKQVTSGGTAEDPWQSPTQSDAGVVVAHRSGLIHRMNQRGELFNVIDPPAIPDALGNRLEGRDLTETAISPDGSKIAYTYYKFSFGERRWVTAFTASSQLSDFMQWGLSFYDKPAWVTNSRVVLNSWYGNRSHLHDLGVRDIAWFDERFYTPDPKELSDLEVSRDGKWVVGVRGDVGDQSLAVIPIGGDVLTAADPWKPDRSTVVCELGRTTRNFTEPTLAPDGSTLAWTQPTGIYRVNNMNCDASTDSILIAPGGSDSSWSAAAYGQTPSVPPTSTPTPTATPTPTPAPGDPDSAAKQFTVKKGPKVSGKARVGKVLKVSTGVWSPKPKSFKIRWTRDGKVIKKAIKASYRLTRNDRGHKIAAKVTVKRPGYATATKKTKAVRVRR